MDILSELFISIVGVLSVKSTPSIVHVNNGCSGTDTPSSSQEERTKNETKSK